MWCRQLFLDGEGAPTTVTKTDNEKLRIVYDWRLYPTLIPTTDVVVINSISIDCDSRAMEVNEADAWGLGGLCQWLGGEADWPTDYRKCRAHETSTFPAVDGGNFVGESSLCTSITSVAYGAGNFYRDQDIIWDPGVGNWSGGIGAVSLPRHGPYIGGKNGQAVTFTPHVAKSDLQRFTFRYRVSFGRH